jgi:hypothetical protein
MGFYSRRGKSERVSLRGVKRVAKKNQNLRTQNYRPKIAKNFFTLKIHSKNHLEGIALNNKS